VVATVRGVSLANEGFLLHALLARLAGARTPPPREAAAAFGAPPAWRPRFTAETAFCTRRAARAHTHTRVLKVLCKRRSIENIAVVYVRVL
jgi:hypothetical protein